MSEKPGDTVSSTLKDLKEKPVGTSVNLISKGINKLTTLFGITTAVRKEVEDVTKIRLQQGEEAKDRFSRGGGAFSELPSGSPLDAQVLWGRESIGSLLKMKDNKLDRAVQVNFEEAPCDITTVENGKLKVYKKGSKVDTILNPGTEIESTGAFRRALKRNTKGRFGLGTLAKWTKGLIKNIAMPAVGLGAAITTGSLVSGLLSNLGAPAFMSTIKALSLKGILAGTFSFTGVGAALLTAVAAGYVGYKVAKYLRKLVPANKAKFLYARDTESTDIRPEDIQQYLSPDGTLMANHFLSARRGTEITQEGDIVLGINMRAKNLGTRVQRPDGRIVKGFYDATGKLYEGSQDVPAGTKIPHGTKWINKGVIPAGSKYSEAKAYTNKSLKEGTLTESIRIDVEGGVTIPAPIKLNTGVYLPFSYTDMRDPEHTTEVRAGEYSEPGAVIDIRKLPKGTELPAGTVIGHDVISEGEADINTTEKLRLAHAVVLPHVTRLRRDITVGSDGILIPVNTTEMVELPGGQPQAVNDLPGNVVEEDGRNYKRYTGPNGVLLAGSLFPADSKLPPRAKLTRHSVEDSEGNDNRERVLPVGQRFTRDIALNRRIALDNLAVSSGIHPNNIRLRIGDFIPGDQNPLPAFMDPENPGVIYSTGQPIPAGVCIPAFDVSGSRIRIPEDMVIPGGSEVYDSTKKARPELSLALIQRALSAIRGVNVATSMVGVIGPDQYRDHLQTLPDVPPALSQANDVQGQQIEAAIEKKLLEAVLEDIKNAKTTINAMTANNITAAGHNYLNDMQTDSDTTRAREAIDEIVDPDQQKGLTINLEKAMVNKISNILTQLINTDLRTYYGPGGPGAGGIPAANRKNWFNSQTAVTNIRGVIPQLTDSSLHSEVVDYSMNTLKNIAENQLRDAINDLSS